VKAVALVLLTLAAYWPSFRGPFLWDDDAYLAGNRHVTQPGQLGKIWFSTEPADYYPVTFTLFRAQWLAWGAHPLGYRVVNVLLHALNALLLWQLARRWELRGAWLIAALFALHPLNVATVAWIAELKNLLAFGLAGLTVLAWERFDATRRPAWYAAALGAFLLALLSKSAVAPLPVVLLGLTWWRRQRWNFLASLPLFALSAGFGLLTIWFQHHRLLESIPVREADFLTRLTTAGSAAWFYLGKALVPINQMLIYPPLPAAIWPVLALVGCLVWSYRRRGLFVAFAGYVVMLLPVLGFVDQGFYLYSLVADHWQYVALPLVLAAVVAAGAMWFPGQMQMPASVGVVAAFFVLTLARANLYADAVTLWSDTLAKNPGAWVAHYNLGVAQSARGDWATAEAEYRAALRLNPRHIEAHNNLGNLLAQTDRLDEAATHFQAALQLNPRVAAAHNNLGAIYARQGRLQEARDCFREALRLDPHYADAAANLQRVDKEL
jgi:tetratricopeptide (TPR) repeat protein